MSKRFRNKPDIFILDDIPKGFLQVLLPEFVLTKKGQALLLDISIENDLHAIRDSAGKKQFFDSSNAAASGRKQLKKDLARFHKKPELLSCRFDCSKSLLRYGNGGVLPVIRWRDENNHVDEYFCLFYRDIFPIGWNIANGASDTIEEMLDPERILLREFGEELLIRDDEQRIIYSFDPGRDKDPGDSPSKARKAWEKKRRTKANYSTLSVPMTWISGPDQVRVTSAGGSKTSGGYFLNIVPDDNAIEVDRVALVNLRGKVSLFDGEQSRGVILNRAVGLFNIERFRNGAILNDHDFRPDKVFFEGKPGDPEMLEKVISRQIKELMLPETRFRTRENMERWVHSPAKWDLCPISRIMISRYLKNGDGSHQEVDKRPPKDPRKESCDVFISYRSVDQSIAQWLHDYLKNADMKIFFSAESLPVRGESDYAAAIDVALESAKCMVVLGTSKECFDSGWVGYEWRSFLNEKLSGRKKDSQLITFVSGVAVHELPFALRNLQMIPFSATSPQDSAENLLHFLRQALGRES